MLYITIPVHELCKYLCEDIYRDTEPSNFEYFQKLVKNIDQRYCT